MKTIQLTPRQRKEIGERRRQAQDRRVYQRLSAVLWSDDGRTREEIARLVGVSTRQVGQWLRIFRNKGLDELGTLHYQGDPGRLGPAQVKRLRQEIETGVFHNADQVRTWIESTFGVSYSASGVKDLLRRIGASYHKVSGFFWKADVEEQKKFVRKHRRHKHEAGPTTRRYFVDACHPVWGVDLLYSCWLLVGQRFYVGVGNGRKRLNILGAYSPDDHDYVDLRLTKENITGEQFVKLLEKLLAKHPEAEKFLLYLDNARYYSKPVVKEWLAAHPQFRLVPLPAYSPNLNLIERLWKFLRKKALNRWHKTFEEMQAAVAGVLDRLGDYRDELSTLMTERFAIVEVEQAVAWGRQSASSTETGPRTEGHRDSPSRLHELTELAHHETPVRASTSRHSVWKEVLDRRRYTVKSGRRPVEVTGLIRGDVAHRRTQGRDRVCNSLGHDVPDRRRQVIDVLDVDR